MNGVLLYAMIGLVLMVAVGILVALIALIAILVRRPREVAPAIAKTPAALPPLTRE